MPCRTIYRLICHVFNFKSLHGFFLLTRCIHRLPSIYKSVLVILHPPYVFVCKLCTSLIVSTGFLPNISYSMFFINYNKLHVCFNSNFIVRRFLHFGASNLIFKQKQITQHKLISVKLILCPHYSQLIQLLDNTRRSRFHYKSNCYFIHH